MTTDGNKFGIDHHTSVPTNHDTNVCRECGYTIGPLIFEWVDEAPESVGVVNYCGGCGRPVEEVLDPEPPGERGPN